MKQIRKGTIPIKIIAVLLILQVFALPLVAQEENNQALTAERIAMVKAEAEAMCGDSNVAGYGFGGFMCGIIGWAIAVSSNVTPPAEALLQYNAAEQEIFISAYEKCVKSKRSKAACSGWILGSLLSLAIMSSGGA